MSITVFKSRLSELMKRGKSGEDINVLVTRGKKKQVIGIFRTKAKQ